MIRFDCQCGKTLEALPALAGTVGVCPICGTYVAVPQPFIENAPAEDDGNVYALATEPQTERDATGEPAFAPAASLRAIGKRDPVDAWLESLPRRKFMIGISGALALLTGLGIAISPMVLKAGPSPLSGLFLVLAWMGITAVCTGYGCRYLESVLECELRGGGPLPEPPDLDPGPAAMCFLKWAVCFVAGPAFFVYEALRYWIGCGGMTIADGMILAELTVPALGYWLMAVFVLNNRPEIAVPSPWQVLKAIRRLGRRALPAGAALTAAGAIHLWLGLNALVLLDTSMLTGLILLWICWFSLWHCATLAARTLGAWHSRPRASQTSDVFARSA